MQLSHRQKITATTVLVVVVIVFFLALAEGTVRLRQWMQTGHSGKISDLFREENGLRVLVPNARTRTISINAQGFRGPSLAQPKAANDLRIAFIGASTTFCAEVSGDNMTWPHLVTETIQKEYSDIHVDYVNAAVPGYTVKSSLINFRRRVAALHPDVTIIYHATNDISWETRWLALEQGVYEEPQNEDTSWLAEHSQLWYLVMKNLRIKEAQNDAREARMRLDISGSRLGVSFRKELTELVNEAMKVSSMVVLIEFSHRIRPEQTPDQQLAAASSALYYMPFMDPQGLLEVFTRYNRIIAEVASATGAYLIENETVIPADSEHFNDSVHFRDAGSRVMAQHVAEALLHNPGFQVIANSKRGGS